MSDTVGRIDLILDVDGKGLPGKVRRAGEKAGDDAGEGFNDHFNDEITKGAKERNKKIGDEGRKAGESYSDARDRILQKRNKGLSDRLAKAFETPKGLSDYVNRFDTAQEAIAKMREELKELRKQNLITDEDFKRNNATLTQNRRALIRAKDAANDLAGAQERMNRDWDEAIAHNKAFDRAMQVNQRNVQKYRKEIESNLNRSLDELARKQRQVEKDSAAWAKALERSGVQMQRLRKETDKLRISVGNTFRDGDQGIDRYVKQFPTVREGVNRLGADLERLRNQNVISAAEFDRSAATLRKYTGNVFELDRGLRSVEKSSGRATGGIKNFNGRARQMPYFLKTVAGYTALFTALAPGIATLGSVTGSGALALAVGAGALGAALVTLIPAFKGMLDNVDKLPAKARPAAQALQDMATPLSDLQDTIQEGVFDGLGPQINKLSQRIFPRLEKGFGKTAKTINGLFRDLISGLTSDSALGRIDRIFDGLQPVLKSLGRAIFSLGSSLAKLFEAALPSGQKFAGFLEDILGDFNSWLDTEDGQQHLTDFFDHLNEIMPSIGQLIGAAGKAVSGLVTDQAVTNMVTFLDEMSNALPGVVGGFGELVDALDPLGLASQALEGLGSFMDAHKGDFSTLGSSIHDFIQSGAGLVGPIIKGIADQLLRVSPSVFENLGNAFDELNTPELQNAVKDTLPKLGDVLVAASKAVGSLLKALGDSGTISNAIGQIGNAAQVATPLLDGVSIALDTATGKFQDAADTLDGIDFSGFLNGITNLSKLASPILAVLDTLGSKIFGHTLTEMNTNFGNILNGFFEGVARVFPTAMTTLYNYAKAAVVAIPSLIGTLFKTMFGLGGKGGDGSDEGKKAGEKGVKDVKTGVEGAIPTVLAGIGPKIAAKLVEGFGNFDLGPTVDLFLAPFKAVPQKIGEFLAPLAGFLQTLMGGLSGPGQTGADNLSNPFSLVPPGLNSMLGGIPGIIGGIMGLVSGQPGADNTKNPFNDVKSSIDSKVAGVPGSVTDKIAQSSGQRGADNSANPFNNVKGKIDGSVSGVPSSVTNKIAQASGQRGADNTSNPFNSVQGKIKGKVDGVPGVVSGALSSVSGQSAADRIVSAFSNVKSRVASALSGLGGFINGLLSTAGAGLSAGIASLRNRVPKTAVGGTFNGAQMRIIGEAGPEAVVPLNRPLSQVDPSVRALSALAQGKFPAASSSRAEKVVTVAEGAIAVYAPNSDPEQVASAALDRLVAKLP
jgi:uncharacterized protein YqgQ